MDHPRSKLPAVLAILFCIALLGGVGVLLWKTLPEKQQPQQAETIQTDSVFSSEQTAVEPEREAPYEGELPEQAEAAQPEQPDSEQPSEPAADPAAPDDAPVTDAQKTAQATLASMTEDEKLWQQFFVTPEANTNSYTAKKAVADDFLAQRESNSGVQRDEETANMLVYQKAYQASARIMSVMDNLLDTLINDLGAKIS